MGEMFVRVLQFAKSTFGRLNKCNLYDNGFANMELTTPDGKILKITMTIEEENKDA